VWLDTLVCQLLEKKPEHRPFDAVVVAQALDQVAEKVAAQQSAGIDAVRTGKGKRPAGDGSGEGTTEQKAVRRMRKGRRKRRRKPTYETRSFQAVSLSVLLLAIAAILLMVFRAP